MAHKVDVVLMLVTFSAPFNYEEFIRLLHDIIFAPSILESDDRSPDEILSSILSTLRRSQSPPKKFIQISYEVFHRRQFLVSSQLQVQIWKFSSAVKPRIHKHAEWFANHSRMVCEPNAHMCRWDCEPVLCCRWTVCIPFAANQNFLVFCTNIKRTGCAGCPFHAPGVLCSP